MKFQLSSVLGSLALLAAILGGNAYAQDGLKIAVVDMQQALNDYYKTEIEVQKINEMAEEKRKNIDERQAAYQQMTAKMSELDKKVKDSARAESDRRETMEELRALAQERSAKGQEISDAQRKASSEVMQARKEMEDELVSEIREVVDGIVEAQGYDLVFDESFLPKANKAILYTSENVPNLTEEVISTLNAGAPSGTTSTSGTTSGTSGSAETAEASE